jgi:hypothetical protein
MKKNTDGKLPNRARSLLIDSEKCYTSIRQEDLKTSLLTSKRLMRQQNNKEIPGEPTKLESEQPISFKHSLDDELGNLEKYESLNVIIKSIDEMAKLLVNAVMQSSLNEIIDSAESETKEELKHFEKAYRYYLSAKSIEETRIKNEYNTNSEFQGKAEQENKNEANFTKITRQEEFENLEIEDEDDFLLEFEDEPIE